MSFEIEDPKRESSDGAESKLKDYSCSAKYYIFLALGAGLCFGTQNFFFSLLLDKKSHGKFDIRFFMPSVMGHVLSALVFHLKEACDNYKNHGRFWVEHRSAYYM